MELTHLSLFTGIGGIDLAAERAGFKTVGQCENGDFQTKVLNKHWPHVPKWREVQHVTAQSVRARGIQRINLISGGYPCQGESLVGSRKGADDERWLWPEMFRITKELRPDWVFGENVIGHVTAGLDEVLTDLASEGYAARAFVLPACVFGANHERYRVFVIGYSGSESKLQTDSAVGPFGSGWDAWNDFAGFNWPQTPQTYWQIHQPPIPGVDDGIPDRVDRSIALGNAVMPQQAYPFLKAIYETHIRYMAA